VATDDSTRREMLKELIRQLHAGASPQEVKERFKQVLEGLSALEIAKIEEELIGEGISREEIQRLCEVHLAVFREQIERQREAVSIENPVHILREEHRILLGIAGKLGTIVNNIKRAEDKSGLDEKMTHLRSVVEDLLDAEKHYLREENVLFPILEKHGIKEPAAIMWMEHNQLREEKKRLHSLVENYDTMNLRDFQKQLSETAKSIVSTLSSHVFKENNILFPSALRVVKDDEWKEAGREFDEIGYCRFTPKDLVTKSRARGFAEPKLEALAAPEGLLQFETGMLSKDEVETILNALPVDITFIDKEDTVRYFSKAEKRIFVRAKAVIGRKVQLCHPQKSVHIVNGILESFKKGEKDVAEFWINFKGRLVHIRYFAVRDKDGKYLGTMEVTQDITDIKKVEGEKRLLDWKD